MTRTIAGLAVVSLSVAVLMSCASSGVDPGEAKLLVGRENDVRIDAKISTDQLRRNVQIELSYEVSNLRSTPIAIAEVRPMTEYDPESRTITIVLGSEVPGNDFLPRLVRLNSGEKRSFSIGTRVAVPMSAGAAGTPAPRYIRVKLNLLGDVAPFGELIDIPERAIADRAKADALFPLWVEATETVTTNSVTVFWQQPQVERDTPARRR
jgi:hypothetical protein